MRKSALYTEFRQEFKQLESQGFIFHKDTYYKINEEQRFLLGVNFEAKPSGTLAVCFDSLPFPMVAFSPDASTAYCNWFSVIQLRAKEILADPQNAPEMRNGIPVVRAEKLKATWEPPISVTKKFFFDKIYPDFIRINTFEESLEYRHRINSLLYRYPPMGWIDEVYCYIALGNNEKALAICSDLIRWSKGVLNTTETGRKQRQEIGAECRDIQENLNNNPEYYRQKVSVLMETVKEKLRTFIA